MTLLKTVSKTIEKHKMLKKGDRVVVGVSGGPDSVALVYLFQSLARQYDLTIHIAHLDHGIRGKESREDLLFCKALAKTLELPITVHRIDTPRLAKTQKRSLEEAARVARYQFFLEVASHVGARKIATGHTADDQAETVLMRIIRGSGMGGLGGIAPIGELKAGVRLIRPLLEVWREDIERYLKQEGLESREDSSNRDLAFLRNKIRLELIPHLGKNYNPKVKERLVRLSESLRDDYSYLKEKVEKAFSSLSSIQDREVSLDATRMRRYPLAIQRGCLRLAIKEVKGDLRRISYRNWEDMDHLIRSSDGCASLDLVGGLKVRRSYGKLTFQKSRPQERRLEFSWRLRVPGTTEIPEADLRIEAEVVDGDRAADIVRSVAAKKINNRKVEVFDYDRLKFPLTIRNRRPGDKIRPFGMKGTKKVKDIFIDRKVPLSERASVPLAATEDGEVFWVVGIKVADQYKLRAQTKRVLKMRLVG